MAGWEPAAALDVDLDAVRTYRTNHPGVPCVVKDIRRVPAAEIADTAGVRPGELDALIAGVPCEGYSLLNRRYDASDPRNHLFLEFLRITRLLRPKLLLIENVPGMRRRANGGFARAVLESFEALGYRASAHELDALGYGVPQQRLRLFFVGVREDLGTRFSPPGPTAERGLTVREAISDLPPVRPGEKATRYGGPPLCEYQREARAGCKTVQNHVAPRHPEWTVKRIASTPPGQPLYSTFKQRVRLSWDSPSPTIPAGGVRPQWFFAHPDQPRGLTVREMARLQSFPDSFVFLGSTVKQRVLVGDAVPPLLARAVAHALLGCLDC
jgi:DNA (cytosine-5)-methyltransferase 1